MDDSYCVDCGAGRTRADHASECSKAYAQRLPRFWHVPKDKLEVAVGWASTFDYGPREAARREVQSALEAYEKARVAYERAKDELRQARERQEELLQTFAKKFLKALGGPTPGPFDKAFVVADHDDIYVQFERISS